MPATGYAETSVVAKVEAAENSDLAAGMALTALIPALFWTALFAACANVLGYQPTVAALSGLALAIAAFLALVFAAITPRAR